jgi:molybdate transport system ATP-binding protein
MLMTLPLAQPGSDPLFIFRSATLARGGGTHAVRQLNWAVRAGETWAVVGPVGSGKTTVVEAVLGRHRLLGGEVTRPLVERLRVPGRPVASPADVVRLVSFKEESWRFSYGRHYYQQRFNFIEAHDDLTLNEFLRGSEDLADETVREAVERVGLDGLLGLSFIKLSNGQVRRARIARALLARPELLLLDDPFMGLDAAGRDEVAGLLGRLSQDGQRILLITRPDVIPPWVTHVLELDKVGGSWQGTRTEFSGRLPLPPVGIAGSSSLHPSQGKGGKSAGAPVVELHNVTVAYDGRPVLRDVSWTVRIGERWAVLGPNGSGKSTLLSLLCGDHPQAYSNDVRLFGRQRGTGETIWEIKQRLGLVSPELHLYYSEPLTAAEAVATGFFDVLAYRRPSAEQEAVVQDLFDHFGIADLAARPFARLSTGEQRLVLFVRALVKSPPLLILDEPFQGLDDRLIGLARDWLDRRLRPEQTLLFVTHYADEIPRSVTRRLRLDHGRVVELT